jgi:hypothetical protein
MCFVGEESTMAFSLRAESKGREGREGGGGCACLGSIDTDGLYE